MLKFFRVPFATTGDKTAVPDAADPNGNVSYTQGYTFDYQRQKTDPAAKNVDRNSMNELFYDVTNAIAEIQGQGIPDFITPTLNGGSAYSYAQNAVVRYSGALYYSLAAANTALPSDATKWALFPTAALIQGAANSSAVAGGTSDAITGAFTPAVAALPAAPGTLSLFVRAGSANATTTPTFQADGTAAKTIVKGSNQALVAGDIAGAGHWLAMQYDATLDKWVLQNPAFGVSTTSASVQGAFKNLQISTTGTNASVSVSADELVLEDSSNAYVTARSVALTINSATTGANGLDAGAVAALSWYSVWVIRKPDGTTAGLLSLSATAPTMPSGYARRARVGWVRTDGTANKYPLSFVQAGRRAQYKVAAGSNVAALPIMASGAAGSYSTPTWASIAVGNYVPSTAGRIVGQAILNAASHVIGAPSNAYGAQGSATNAPPLSVNSTASGFAYPYDFILESSSIYWASDSAANYIQCLGWEDNI